MVKDKWWKVALELEIVDVLITAEGKEQVVKLDKQYSNFLKKYWRWRAKNL